jgi:hypothetical protein
VIDQRQPVPQGFQPVPHRHLLIGCELIKRTGFDGFDYIGEGGVVGIQGHIQRRALIAFGCWWIPEFHTPILFESVFDDNPFFQQNKESYTLEPAPNRSTQPQHMPPQHSPDPFDLEPRTCFRRLSYRRRPELGQGWP